MTEPTRPAATPTVQQGQSTVHFRHDAPPTVRQGQPAPTVLQGEHRAVPTRSQGAAGVPTMQQGGGSATAPTDGSAPEFPAQLRDRFEPLESRGWGTEGVVWRCRRVSGGDEVAVKVYWAGRPVDEELIEHLDDPGFRRHVPEIYESGRLITPHGEVPWIAMEYFASTLTELLAREGRGRGLPPERAKALIAELASALRFWQQNVDRNPLDFKPDNLMIRPGRPEEIVVADFGGVSAFTASQQQGGVIMAAIAYTPPEEVWQEKRSPWPWWSLGEIAYLLITGHTRFQKPDGSMQPDPVIKRVRMVGGLDLDEVADDRWKLLIRGLLTRDSHDRWVYDEVRSWLDGGSPDVVDPASTKDSQPAHGPITFVDGRTFHSPAELAATMLDRWRAAEDWLSGTGRQDLLDWLTKEGLTKRFDVSNLRGLGGDGPRLHRAILAFGAAFAPEQVPRYRGDPVDAAGLVSILAGRGESGFALARELIEHRIFGVAAGYRCQHGECAGDRCAVLDRAAQELPTLVADAQRAIADVRRNPEAARVEGGAGERDRLHGIALLAVLEPHTAKALVTAGWRLRLAGPRWWRAVRARSASADPTTPAGRVAVVAAGVLRESAFADQVGIEDNARTAARTMAAAIGLRLLSALLLFLGMVLLAWVAGVLRLAEQAFGPIPGAIVVAGRESMLYQAALAPALAVLAIVTVALGGRRRGWAVAGCAVAVALALVAPKLPAFTAIGLPAAFDRLLATLAETWGGSVLLGMGLSALAALICVRVSRRVLDRTPDLRLPAGEPAEPLRRVALFALTLVGLLGALWAAGVVRIIALPGKPVLPGELVGRYVAGYESGFVLIVIGLGLLAALGWPPSRSVFSLGLLAALAVGLWAQPIAAIGSVWHPVATEELHWLADRWGGGAFWAALLLAAPLTVLCARGIYRLAGR